MTTCRASLKILPAALALLLLAGAAAVAAKALPGVAPIDSKPRGLTYGQWSARHWQWLFSLPVDAHPLFDTADCSAGQSGHVWFLGGTFASIEVGPGVILGEADRTCTIPSGTALFFPLIDVEASTLEGNGDTVAELRDFAEFFTDFVDPSSVFLEIDGKSADVASFRVQSPLFTFGPLPDNNVVQLFGIDAPEGTTSQSISDGWWAFLEPLSVGTHTIRFGGVADYT